MTTPKLVVFDLFGTLVNYGVMHRPFRQLLKWARENGRPVGGDDARCLMTTDGDLKALSIALGIKGIPEYFLDELQAQINDEIASLTLFDDVTQTLTRLNQLEVPTAICSNLAQPYGIAIERLLGPFNMQLFLSYDIGFMKPEPEIYRHITESTKTNSGAILFIGDTYSADYEGPTQNGFHARHLIRGHASKDHVIGNLMDVIDIVEG